MQELIDALNDLEAVYIQNDWRREVIGINQAKNLIEYIYLEKEKWQIMNAYDTGWLDCKNSGGKDLNDQYYFETFNINDK